MNCRHCYTPLELVFLDLGFAPPSNACLSTDDLRAPERYYPLRFYLCTQCWLVQTEDLAQASELLGHDCACFSDVHTPIHPPAALRERRPDVVLILQPSIACEVVVQHGYVRNREGRFVVAEPELRVAA